MIMFLLDDEYGRDFEDKFLWANALRTQLSYFYGIVVHNTSCYIYKES